MEARRSILEERSVFARRFNVEVAYYSAYTQSCSSEWLIRVDLIAHLKCTELAAAPGKQPVTVKFCVIGKEVDSVVLRPYHWARNMDFLSLFTVAVVLLVPLADESGGKNAVGLLIEIDPHHALGVQVSKS